MRNTGFQCGASAPRSLTEARCDGSPDVGTVLFGRIGDIFNLGIFGTRGSRHVQGIHPAAYARSEWRLTSADCAPELVIFFLPSLQFVTLCRDDPHQRSLTDACAEIGHNDAAQPGHSARCRGASKFIPGAAPPLGALRDGRPMPAARPATR